jgi:hypothetical protein
MQRWLAEERGRLEAEWYRNAMTDACPNCSSPTPPEGWQQDSHDWDFFASYTCEVCRKRWQTGWARSLIENPL